MKVRKILAAVAAAAVSVSALAVSASAYNAYIGYQTTTYSFRNAWDEGSYGGATPYFNSIVIWGEDATNPETFGEEYEDYFDYDINGYVAPAKYTDATFDGAGTYTVKVEGVDWGLKGENDFNLVFVSTDAPNDGTFTCSEAKIIVDGNVVKTVENPVCDESQGHFMISLANIWNADIGSYGLAYPSDSLAIQFTIAGGAADAAPAAADTAADDTWTNGGAPAAGDVAAATDSSKGSPDTGIESVAAIAGLALLAGAGIVCTRKRK